MCDRGLPMTSGSIHSSPRVSVILPVFNGEKYLGECIRSVLLQTMPDFELLIGNDCSNDGSRQIIESFHDKRIQYFYRNVNLGVAGNLNRLVQAAHGPLLRILCQDDVLEENCLETEVQFFNKHSDIGMSFCKTIRMDMNGSEVGRCVLGDLPDVIPPLVCMQHFFYYGCLPGNGSTVCVRKGCFEEVGLFDESFNVAQDFEMWVRICKQKSLGVIHKHLVRLRWHPEQQSRLSSSGVRFVEECQRIRSKLLTLLPKEIQSRARLYGVLRFSVLDVHHAMRCLWEGRFRDFLTVARTIGLLNYFPLGLLCWLFTLNNHLFRPSPKYAD